MIALLLVLSAALDERSETERLAPKYEAQTEVRLWDGTRVDLLSDRYAIEVDWAPKWAEAIGQSLYYAELTGREPAIVLLVTDSTAESRFVYRCQTVCAEHGIRLFVETTDADTPPDTGDDTDPTDPEPDFVLPANEVIATDRDHFVKIVAALRDSRPDGYTVRLAAGILNKADYGASNGLYITDVKAPDPERPYIFTSEDPDNPSVLLGWSTGAIFNGCKNVVFEHLIARGCRTNGFSCGNSTNVTFRHLRVEQHRTTGNTDPYKMSHGRGFVVEDCVVDDGWGPQGQGIDFVDVHDARVSRVSLNGAGRGKHGIQSKQGCTNILIEDSTFTGCKHSAVQVGGTTTSWLQIDEGIDYQAKNVTIRNVTGSNSAFLVSLKSCHDVLFEDCVFDTPTGSGASVIVIAAESADDSAIANQEIVGPLNVEFRRVRWTYNSGTLHPQRRFFKIREDNDIPKIGFDSITFTDNRFTDQAVDKVYPLEAFDPSLGDSKTWNTLPTVPTNPTMN